MYVDGLCAAYTFGMCGMASVTWEARWKRGGNLAEFWRFCLVVTRSLVAGFLVPFPLSTPRWYFLVQMGEGKKKGVCAFSQLWRSLSIFHFCPCCCPFGLTASANRRSRTWWRVWGWVWAPKSLTCTWLTDEWPAETGNGTHDLFLDFYCLIFVNQTTMTWRIAFLCSQ